MNIRIEDLYKSFGRNEVLNGIDLGFDEPGIIGVLGPNGSGKTTLIKCVLGMVIPDSGSISFNGQDISRSHLYRKHISYLSQIAKFPENLTGRELIAFLKKMRTGQKTRESRLISMFDINPELDKRMGYLSGGNRQKVNIILSMLYDDPVIILDEPTTGLDPLSLLAFKNFLVEERMRGKMILLTTHIMNLVEELADKILFLLDGRIHYYGTTDNLTFRENAESLESAIASILDHKKKQLTYEPYLAI